MLAFFWGKLGGAYNGESLVAMKRGLFKSAVKLIVANFVRGKRSARKENARLEAQRNAD